jgi:hypothetical protein
VAQILVAAVALVIAPLEIRMVMAVVVSSLSAIYLKEKI